jgi:hypothetical protein
MPKLKIGSIEDDKPVSLTVKLPAMVYRDLTTYAGVGPRKRAGDCLTDKADCAHVGALYGNGSRIHKNASGNSSEIDRQRIALPQ